jgi:hypothetical protein
MGANGSSQDAGEKVPPATATVVEQQQQIGGKLARSVLNRQPGGVEGAGRAQPNSRPGDTVAGGSRPSTAECDGLISEFTGCAGSAVVLSSVPAAPAATSSAGPGDGACDDARAATHVSPLQPRRVNTFGTDTAEQYLRAGAGGPEGAGGRAAAAACGAAAAAAAQGRPSSQHNSTTQQVAATDSPRSLDLSNLGFGDHGEALSPASSASTRPRLSPQSPAAAAEATDSSSVHGEGGGGGGSGSAAAAVDPVLAIDLDDEALMHEILSSVEGSATPVRSSPAKSSARSDAAAVGGGGGGGPGAGAGDRGEGGDERSESVLSMASMASSGLSATPEPLDVDEMRRKVDGRIKMLSTGEVMESLMEETLD